MDENSPERFPFDISTSPFDEATCSTLIQKRQNISIKKLFIDALLEATGIRNPSAYFPPRNADALRRLYGAYTNASNGHLWKDCVTYYLLRWWHDDDFSARNFQNKRYIPPEYAQLVTAYFYIDRNDIKTGVNLLCDSRVPCIHSSIVIAALNAAASAAVLGNPKAKLENPLLLKYVHVVKPPLVELWELKDYTSALSVSSLGSAWEYQRSFPEGNTRVELIATIIEECFLPDPKPRLIKPLIAFPINDFEEEVIHYLAREPTKWFDMSPLSVTLLHDMVVTRLIMLGQPERALQLESQLSIPVNDEEFAKEAITRRRELISEAVGRDSNKLYSMDIDEVPLDTSIRVSGSPRGNRPINPRHSVYGGATASPVKPASRTSLPGKSNTPLSSRIPEIQVTATSPLPTASASRFATPPRLPVADLENFMRSQGAPSPMTPSSFNMFRPPQPQSPLANIPRGVGSTRNAFYEPRSGQKSDLWGETSKSSFRLSTSSSLESKKSPLSQEVTRENSQEEDEGGSIDEVDQFVINGARHEYRPPSPPAHREPQPSQEGTSPFRFRNSEIRSKKEGKRQAGEIDEDQRGVKRMASSQAEFPGSFPRLEPEQPTNSPPLSKARKKARERSEEHQNHSQENEEETEERDSLPPLPSTSAGRARSSRKKRASSVESDASDISESQAQKVRRSTRLSVAGSDTESIGTSAKRKTRQGSSIRSTTSNGTGRKGKSKA